MVVYSYYEEDTRVIRAAEAAVEAGFGVDVLALRKPGSLGTEIVRGVRVIRLDQAKYQGRNYARYLLAYLEFFLRSLLKTSVLFLKQRYKVVHVNNMPDFLVFSSFIPRLCGAKVILDIHDPMPNTFASKFNSGEGGFFYHALLWQERISAAYSNRVITVHQPVLDGILVKHGLARKSIEVIANFADENLFSPRKSYSTNGKVRFVFHGSILERSGLGVLVQGLARVRHKDHISVRIIGDGDFSPRLKELITSLNLDNIVEFQNWFYPVDVICEHIKDCNVGLVPLEISSATNYALPLKLFEYISLGLPIVSVRNVAIASYLNERDCLFYEWNNPDSLSEAVDRLVENPDMLLYYRARSMELRDRFSWAGEKIKYMSLLRQLAGITA